MAWYVIFLIVIAAAMVIGRIVGLHACAIATQHRGWPGWQPELGRPA
jgi:hypothetical protein